MSAVLVETLAWTGALIALVLVARRPVARLCGPQVAYALWALPLLRLVLPPLTLPAWLAPAPAAPVAVEATRATLAEPLAWQAETVPATFTLAPPPPAEPGFDLMAQLAELPLADALLLVWLGGAAVFLWRRFAAYFDLREDLLAEGREVGRIPARLGAIRLVETPGTAAPLAFGVLDPVIALPPGFMALPDRRARDLALAHELAHHRGFDLLINIAVQPLFALHWFNPLGWLGWAAMRRDQEAACDARVVERIARPEKAAYAALIAGLAAGPNIALAAPMACPVLGEKSIIQRLRSLTMSDISPRRRLLGRALVAGGLLALPLTASISYASPEAPEVAAEEAQPEAIKRKQVIIIDHPDGASPDDASLHTKTITRDGKTIVFKSSEPLDDAEVERRIATAEASRAEAEAMFEREGAVRDERRIVMRHETDLSEAERARLRAELSQSMKEMEIDLAEARDMQRLAMIEMRRELDGELSRIDIDCKDSAARTGKHKDGKNVMVLCRTNVMASALVGLRQAREEIARDKDITGEARAEVLRALDEQIARLSGTDG